MAEDSEVAREVETAEDSGEVMVVAGVVVMVEVMEVAAMEGAETEAAGMVVEKMVDDTFHSFLHFNDVSRKRDSGI